MTNANYQVLPFPKIRRLMEDGGRLGRQKHLVHGLFEMDVTEARRLIHEHRTQTGEGISFTAVIIAGLGRAIDKDKSIQAYRTWRGKLIIFDDVDVNTMFEVEVAGQKIIRPHIIRAVNKKTLRQIHNEIRAFQADHAEGKEGKFIGWFVWLPGFIRRLFLRILFKNPHWLKEMNGTVSLTSVGMFGQGGGWGIPVSNHTLQITLGGIAQRLAMVNGVVETRQVLCITISFDHDIVDGAPAARFAQTLKEFIEGRLVWDEFPEPGHCAGTGR
ncbi:MAG: 2-oxo acid dehydrogenase subunit E2 [Chloroflexi bacterium]|nr:2-oxo acid dehydrogenase subunit E2 [Chloroflexota bacterium]